MITSQEKTAAIKRSAAKAKDTGGMSAQVAILSERIKQVSEHLKVHEHDFMARRGLLQMVGQRRRALTYVARKDSQKYLELIQKLGIRR